MWMHHGEQQLFECINEAAAAAAAAATIKKDIEVHQNVRR
jgi:hypothetical protein